MTQIPTPGLIDSIRARLRKVAEANGDDFQTVLERFAIERLLYRLSNSPLRDRFILKGATLFVAWGGEIQRPSRDLDMLGFGPNGIDDLVEAFRMIVSTSVAPDGLVFPLDVIKGSRIKEGQEYEGVRLVLRAMLGNARIPVQVDVGFGDAVVPPPLDGDFPTLLDLPAPRLQLYPRETVVAEKFQALVALGMLNTRLKDFYDLWALSRLFDFDGQVLCEALRATFARRKTDLPGEIPDALGSEFARQVGNKWHTFTSKSSLREVGLADTVQPALIAFLLPAAQAAREAGASPGTWPAGGPWKA